MLDSMMIYTCPVCGHSAAGMEWAESEAQLKDFKCPKCDHLLNDDELQSEED